MQKIEQLRKLFLGKGEIVGKIEETFGNYNKNGKLIEGGVPTTTTEFCEIGNYDDIIYFTFVIYSDSYNKNLSEHLKRFSNFKIYSFKNFLEDIDIKLSDFEEKIKKEKYFQINFNFSIVEDNETLYYKYIEIKDKILESGIKIVNQLKVDLVKK